VPGRRVAIVSHSPWLGGAERCLLELVSAIAPKRDVHVVLPRDGELREPLRAAGATTHIAPARWWARDPGTPRRAPDSRGVAATARVLRHVAPDVVLSNTLVHPPGAVAAAALGRPHAWWVQEFGERDHGFRFALGLRGTLQAVDRLSRAVLVSSRAVAEELAGTIPAAKLRPLPLAVEVPVAGGPRPRAAGRPPRLAILGRVRPSKGQQDAVRAIAELERRGIGAELDVVGDGELDPLRALAEELGVAGRVRLHGARDDALAVLDEADVALMCSRDEAFGRVTVEAMKRGVPVVGAASGGTTELIEHGVTGLRYTPGRPDELAGEVSALLGDEPARLRIAEAGRRFAAGRFTRERHGAAALAILDEVAEGAA
jgi:glycosyltransferase involved in cell wall biosynthesis